MERLLFCRGDDNLAACPFLVHLLYVLCVFIPFVSILKDVKYKRDETMFVPGIEDKNERGVRVRWMKSNKFQAGHESSRFSSVKDMLYRVVCCMFMV